MSSSENNPHPLKPEEAGIFAAGFLIIILFILFLVLIPCMLHILAFSRKSHKNYLMFMKQKYVDFKTRSSRAQYVDYFIVNFIIFFDLAFIERSIGFTILLSETYVTQDSPPVRNELGILTLIYGLIQIIPHIAATIRRLHDTNRSGWWILISFLPFGSFYILYLTCFAEGDFGDNDYGQNPMLSASAAVDSIGYQHGVILHPPSVNGSTQFHLVPLASQVQQDGTQKDEKLQNLV